MHRRVRIAQIDALHALFARDHREQLPISREADRPHAEIDHGEPRRGVVGDLDRVPAAQSGEGPARVDRPGLAEGDALRDRIGREDAALVGPAGERRPPAGVFAHLAMGAVAALDVGLAALGAVDGAAHRILAALATRVPAGGLACHAEDPRLGDPVDATGARIGEVADEGAGLAAAAHPGDRAALVGHLARDVADPHPLLFDDGQAPGRAFRGEGGEIADRAGGRAHVAGERTRVRPAAGAVVTARHPQEERQPDDAPHSAGP